MGQCRPPWGVPTKRQQVPWDDLQNNGPMQSCWAATTPPDPTTAAPRAKVTAGVNNEVAVSDVAAKIADPPATISVSSTPRQLFAHWLLYGLLRKGSQKDNNCCPKLSGLTAISSSSHKVAFLEANSMHNALSIFCLQQSPNIEDPSIARQLYCNWIV